jgi:hypothetical protein
MTPKDFKDYVHFRCKTDSTSFPDDEILLLAGIVMDDFAREIVLANEDYFGMPMTTDLVAGQREYPFESEVLNQIKFVEAKLDGNDFMALKELDLNAYRRATTESVITANFGNEEGRAFYDIFRGSLWLYSGEITDVPDGLKLWTFTYPKHIADLASTTDMSYPASTTEHGFPRPFHELLGRRVGILWKQSQQNPIPLDERELSFERDFDKAIESIRSLNLDRSLIGSLPSGESMGNDGYDY